MGTAGSSGSARAADAIVDEAMRDLVQQTGDGELTVGAALAATAALRDAADRKVFTLVGFARDAGASRAGARLRWWATRVVGEGVEMRRRRSSPQCVSVSSAFAGFRFPPEISTGATRAPRSMRRCRSPRCSARDGAEGVEMARAAKPDLKIGMEASADDYVTNSFEPLEPLELVDRVNALLSR